MRAKGTNRRAAFRKLGPEERLPALAGLATLGDAAPRWLWAELIELASLSRGPEHPVVSRLRARLGVERPDLDRVRTGAATVLAEHWKCLETQEKDVAVAVSRDTLCPLALQMASASPLRGGASAFELGRSLGEPWSSRIAFMLALRGDADAEHALHELVVGATGRQVAMGAPPVDAERCLQLALGLTFALDQPNEQGNGRVTKGCAWAGWTLLEAIRGLPGSVEATRAIVRAAMESHSPMGRAMAGVLRWDRDPLIRRAAWRWLSADGLSAAAIDRLARTWNPADHEVVLRLGHLCVRPARSRRLALIRVVTDVRTREVGAGGTLPAPDETPRLSVAARRHLPRFIHALDADESLRASAMEALLTDEDESVRAAVASRCGASELRDLCFDESERVARIAAHRWSRCGISVSRRRAPPAEIVRVLSALRTSPHRIVRRIAREDIVGCEGSHPTSPTWRLRVRREAREDPERFLASVRARIDDPEKGETALIEAEIAGALPRLEPELVRLARAKRSERDTDARLLATIARCLRSIATTQAREAIASLMESFDDRTRANAVDAAVLGAWSRVDGDAQRLLVGRLLEMKSDRAHRVRGAAARGLASLARRATLDPVAAAEALRDLIEDARAEHVAAGLWAASRSAASLGDSSFNAWAVVRARSAAHAFQAAPTVVGQSRALLARLGASDRESADADARDASS